MPYCGNTNEPLELDQATKTYQRMQSTSLFFTTQNAFRYPTAQEYVSQLFEEAPEAKAAVRGKLAVVTGVSVGSIGFHMAAALAVEAQMGGVVLLGRSMEKLEETEAAIVELASQENVAIAVKLYTVLFDLDDLGTAVSAAKEITDIAEQHHDRKLHVLLHNAGSMAVHLKEDKDNVNYEDKHTIHYRTTKQGVEANAGRNFLAPHLLTHLLIPILEAAARCDTSHYKPRVVMVSTMGHCGGTDWSPHYFSESPSLGGAPEGSIVKNFHTGEYTGPGGRSAALAQYARSKMAMIADVRAFQDHYPNINFTAVHPGSVATNIGSDGDVGMALKVYFYAFYPFQLKPSQGARSALRAALDPEFNTCPNLQGAYLHSDGNPWPPHPPTLLNPDTKQPYTWEDYANDTYEAADKLCTVLFYNK